MKHRNKFLPTISSKQHLLHARYALQLKDLFQCLQYTPYDEVLCILSEFNETV